MCKPRQAVSCRAGINRQAISEVRMVGEAGETKGRSLAPLIGVRVQVSRNSRMMTGAVAAAPVCVCVFNVCVSQVRLTTVISSQDNGVYHQTMLSL